MTAVIEFPAPTVLHPRFDVEPSAQDDGLSAFVSVRPRLFAMAYRMLGSAADAEDIVQDVWLRWQFTNRNVVRDPPAFLATTTKRLCINLARSAHTRRETYVGPWLPEPVGASPDPGLAAEREEALKFAVLALLEKLCPTERAAYVLREAFDYAYCQIADILQMEEANVRQLVSRARRHIADGRRAPVSSAEQRRLLVAFIDAAQEGNLAALEELFISDAVSQSDGHKPAAAFSHCAVSKAEFEHMIRCWALELADQACSCECSNSRSDGNEFLTERTGLLR